MSEDKPTMQAALKGRKLTIAVEIDKDGHLSSTGKSVIVYSSRGFQWPEGIGLGISINVIKSKRAQ